MTETAGEPRAREDVAELVQRLATERGQGKTICPTEAAKEVARQLGEENWQARLPAVKAAAVGLARRGEVAIYRKGKPVDPDDFKGIYRIGLPPEGAPVVPAGDEGETPGS